MPVWDKFPIFLWFVIIDYVIKEIARRKMNLLSKGSNKSSLMSMHKIIKSQQTVIFLHIPKTAGSTLFSLARRQYKADAIFHVMSRDYSDFKELQEDRRNKFELVGGHMCFGVHEHIPGPSTYFTILRHPLERVLSYYYYLRDYYSRHQLDDEQYLLELQKDLAEFVATSQILEVDNGQTRRLVGTDGYKVGFGQCSQEMLEKAKQNILESFSVVGITERFYETILLLGETFAWKNKLFINKNVTQNKPERHTVDQRAIDLISKYNEFDIELYAFAKNLLREQIDQAGRAFEMKVQVYRTIMGAFNSIFSFTQSK
jgi:hypothetical protein